MNGKQNTIANNSTFEFIPLAMFATIMVAAATLIFPIGRLGFFLFFAIVGLSSFLLVAWYSRNSTYTCKECNHEFTNGSLIGFIAPQSIHSRYLKCPKCESRAWANEVF